VCSDHYFDEFVYEVIIDRKYLNDAQKALLEEEPYEIMPWQV
jgi:bleomycin hydrolase